MESAPVLLSELPHNESVLRGYFGRVGFELRDLEGVWNAHLPQASYARLLDPGIRLNPEVVSEWHRLRSADMQRDSFAALPAFATFLVAFERLYARPERFHGFDIVRAKSEAAYRLFQTCYLIARVWMLNPQRRSGGRALMQEAIRIAALVRAGTEVHGYGKRFYGMRGAAYLYLARGLDDDAVLLEKSASDLRRARELGDTTSQHYSYECEALLRLHKQTVDPSYKAEIEELLRSPQIPPRRVAYTRGELAMHRLFAAVAGEDMAAQQDCAAAAIQAYGAALAAPREAFDSCSDDLLQARRGHARLRAFMAAGAAADVTALDEVIEELKNLPANVLPGGTVLTSALLTRAEHNIAERPEDALRDLDAILTMDVSASRESQQAAAIAGPRAIEARLRVALNSADSAALEAALAAFLRVDIQHDTIISIGPLRPAVLRVIAGASSATADAWLLQAVEFLEQYIRTRSTEHPDQLRYAAGLAANMMLKLSAPEDDDLDSVLELYRIAIESDPASCPPDLPSFAASTALELAKRLLRRGADEDRGRALLEMSCAWFESAVNNTNPGSAAFIPRETHSKAGEAYVRLHALSGIDEYASLAIQHFDHSRQLGNASPELIGLLGDAYYRRGRGRGDADDLRTALRMKAAARDAGHQSRENFSVSAAAAARLWQLSHDPCDLAQAIALASDAQVVDPKWPWPPLQIAEYLSEPPAVRDSVAANLQSDGRVQLAIVEAVRRGEVDDFLRTGARLAVATTEFDRRRFGGRRRHQSRDTETVHWLDDPHGLLSEAFVFKPCDARRPRVEIDSTREFAAFLARRSAPPYLVMPQPVDVVERAEGAPIYVMKRARGTKLGTLVIDAMVSRNELPVTSYHRCLEFLAYFHAWAMPANDTRSVRDARMNVRDALSPARVWTSLGAPAGLARRVEALGPHLAGFDLLPVRKKDAHAENWLVMPRSDVMIIDLESTKVLPLLYEVAQLVEDYPLAACDAAGDNLRGELLATYLSTFSSLVPSFALPSPEVAISAFQSFAIARSLIGVASIHQRRRNQPTGLTSSVSSSLRAAPFRERHYVALMEHLTSAGVTCTIRESAKLASELFASVHASPR
jgi:tetratricopeptide (TPR) repeat protein